jgi:hypothetical protein
MMLLLLLIYDHNTKDVHKNLLKQMRKLNSRKKILLKILLFTYIDVIDLQ